MVGAADQADGVSSGVTIDPARGGTGSNRRSITIGRFVPLRSIAVLLIATALVGCGREDERSIRKQLTTHAELSLTDKTHSQALQEELARIRADKGWPMQLVERQPPADSEDDLTAAVSAPFASAAEIDRIHRSLNELWPDEGLKFSPTALEHARRIVARLRPDTVTFLAALRRPKSAFRVGVDQGIVEDTAWVEAARLVARVRVMEGIDEVYRGAPEGGIEPLADLIRLASKLEAAPSLVAHLAAVDIRRWIVSGMMAIATSDAATRRTHELLFELASADRREAGSERTAWIGDRAAGMHAYEMVRAGEYLSLLTREEYDRLEERNETMDHALVVRRNVDDDELWYLETMRELIARSETPYFERRAWLDERFESLDAVRDAPRFPSVAADLLLIGITTAQQRLARGRARRDAWYLALAAAVDRPLTDGPTVNPETGTAYEVRIDGDRIEVLGLAAEDSDLTPILVRRAG